MRQPRIAQQCVQPKEYSHAINAAHTCTRSGSTLVTSVLAVRIALRLWCSRRLLLEMVSQPGEQCQSSDARSSPRSRGLTKLCTKTNVQREPTRMAEFPLSDALQTRATLTSSFLGFLSPTARQTASTRPSARPPLPQSALCARGGSRGAAASPPSRVPHEATARGCEVTIPPLLARRGMASIRRARRRWP